MTPPRIISESEFNLTDETASSGAQSPDIQLALNLIQTAVIEKKDVALIEFTAQFDRVSPDHFNLVVSQSEIDRAMGRVSSRLLTALKTAHASITDYHRHQFPSGWKKSPKDGVEYGLQYSPMDCVGLYVPGGRAIYPSSVLMNAIPAAIAQVPSIVMCTPPQPDGSIPDSILAAASISGVSKIIKVGGAQAVFGMAYGTESVPKVDKIVGPGNKYVDGAKQRVYGVVDIDKPAGPSEVLVYVTDATYAAFAASELLAQLEHDPDAKAIAITLSPDCATAIATEFNALIQRCKRRDIIEQSVKNSFIVQCESQSSAINLINKIASEHLVLLTDFADEMLPQIRHAGSIFMGPYTPVALGDYIAGPNHVLPTNAAARFSSPLGVMDFFKYSAFCKYSKTALAAIQPTISELTQTEGFDAHQLSVDIRL